MGCPRERLNRTRHTPDNQENLPPPLLDGKYNNGCAHTRKIETNYKSIFLRYFWAILREQRLGPKQVRQAC